MTITATAVLSTTFDNAPGFQITISGLSGVAGASTISVRLTSPGPASNYVRGLTNITIVGDSVTATDYEFTLAPWPSVQFVYTYEIFNVAGVLLTSGTISVSTSVDTETLKTSIKAAYPQVNAILRSITYPSLSVPIIISGDMNTWTIPSRVLGNMTVLGKANPIVIRDVSGGRSGNLTVHSAYGSDLENLIQLLSLADTLMFVPFNWTPGFRDMYFAVSGDISPVRIGPISSTLDVSDAVAAQMFTTSIPFTEVDRPTTNEEVQLSATWQQVLSSYATWQAVLDHVGYSTWLDVLNDPTGV